MRRQLYVIKGRSAAEAQATRQSYTVRGRSTREAARELWAEVLDHLEVEDEGQSHKREIIHCLRNAYEQSDKAQSFSGDNAWPSVVEFCFRRRIEEVVAKPQSEGDQFRQAQQLAAAARKAGTLLYRAIDTELLGEEVELLGNFGGHLIGEWIMEVAERGLAPPNREPELDSVLGLLRLTATCLDVIDAAATRIASRKRRPGNPGGAQFEPSEVRFLERPYESATGLRHTDLGQGKPGNFIEFLQLVGAAIGLPADYDVTEPYKRAQSDYRPPPSRRKENRRKPSR